MRKTGYLLLILTSWLLSIGFTGCQSGSTQPVSPPQPAAELVVSVLGTPYTLLLDSNGSLLNDTEVTTADTRFILKLDKGIKFLNAAKQPLSSLQVDIELEPSLPPARSRRVSAVYTIESPGAIFEPPLTLILAYDPFLLPSDATEDSLYIMSYDENTGWGRLEYNQVDTEKNLVTTHISRSARYGVLSPSETEKDTIFIPPLNPDKLEIFYFYSNYYARCSNCTNVEYATRSTIETYYKDELESGKIMFKVADISQYQNEAIVQKYRAFTSSLFVDCIKDGASHIVEITDIWAVSHSRELIETRLRKQIDYYLTGVKP